MIAARHAWAFLTRMPGGAHPDDDAALGGAVPWFPAVGLVLGGLGAIVWLGGRLVLPELVAATLALATIAFATGGFHLDGLADVADSFGGWTPEQRLEIMRDSRLGTFGVLALIFAVILQVSSLASLDPVDGAIAIVAANGLGRVLALGLMLRSTPAAHRGLGSGYLAGLPRGTTTAVVAAAGIACLAGPVTLLVLGCLVVVGSAVAVDARRRLGGMSGDVLGAAEQLAETAVFVVVAAATPGLGWFWGAG